MRAQTTTEYMIFISVVIVLLLIAIVPVLDFSEFGLNQEARSYERYWTSAPIGVLSHGYNTTHIALNLQNNFKHNIRVDAIYAEDVVIYEGMFSMSPGDTATYAFSYVGASISTGDPYEFDIKFNYTAFGFYGDLTPYSAYYVFYGQAPITGTAGVLGNLTVLD